MYIFTKAWFPWLPVLPPCLMTSWIIDIIHVVASFSTVKHSDLYEIYKYYGGWLNEESWSGEICDLLFVPLFFSLVSVCKCYGKSRTLETIVSGDSPLLLRSLEIETRSSLFLSTCILISMNMWTLKKIGKIGYYRSIVRERFSHFCFPCLIMTDNLFCSLLTQFGIYGWFLHSK